MPKSVRLSLVKLLLIIITLVLTTGCKYSAHEQDSISHTSGLSQRSHSSTSSHRQSTDPATKASGDGACLSSDGEITDSATGHVLLGTRIRVHSPVKVRSAPELSDETLLGKNPTNSTGTIVDGPVLSDDPNIPGQKIIWWKIDFDEGLDGWSGQVKLIFSGNSSDPEPVVFGDEGEWGGSKGFPSEPEPVPSDSIDTAASYFVSPSGSNNADGSFSNPWKTIQYAADRVQPGDTVVVRRGVYEESITMKTSGTLNERIRFITYPGEVAIIDGTSNVSSSWTQCSSQSECLGAENYSEIYYAPFNGSFMGSHLMEGNRVLFPAQSPLQPDEFNRDDVTYFARPAEVDGTKTSITDPDHLAGVSDLSGAYIGLFAVDNRIKKQPIVDFDAHSKTMSFDKFDKLRKTEDYTLYNHIRFLKQPGQYVIDEQANRVYVIPYKYVKNVRVSRREVGFDLDGHSHITIDGFKIRGFSGTTTWEGVGVLNKSYMDASGIVVQNCRIYGNKSESLRGALYLGKCTNCRAAGNWVAYNQNRGIHLAKGENALVDGNLIRKNGGTGIFFQEMYGSEISGNFVLDNQGIHANGISVYQDSLDNRILDNIVVNSNFSVTIKDSNGTLIEGNLLKDNARDSSRMLVLYGGSVTADNTTVRYNTLLNSEKHTALYTGANNSGVVFENNIVDGLSYSDPTQFSLNGNLFVGLAWTQDEGSLGTSNLLYKNSLNELFIDPAKGDFRLRSGNQVNGMDLCKMSTDSSAPGAFGCE